MKMEKYPRLWKLKANMWLSRNIYLLSLKKVTYGKEHTTWPTKKTLYGTVRHY